MFEGVDHSTTEIRAKGCVKTSSRMQMWWLTKVRRFHIEEAIRHPKRFSFGKVVYENWWILRSPE